jgi:hypothetical protein
VITDATAFFRTMTRQKKRTKFSEFLKFPPYKGGIIRRELVSDTESSSFTLSLKRRVKVIMGVSERLHAVDFGDPSAN